MKTNNRATPKYIPPRPREWKPKAHLRQHEIDTLPRPVGMPGVGNGRDNGRGEGR